MPVLNRAVALAFVVLLNGCTTYLYQGEIRAEDSSGVARRTQLYWTKTDPLIGSAKAGPAVLRTACGTPVTYVEQPDAIVFRGVPGQDRLSGKEVSVEPGQECGRILGYSRFTSIKSGGLRLTIHCEPMADEFSVARAYLQARQEPYTFPIQAEEHWSLLGRNPDPPPPPACR